VRYKLSLSAAARRALADTLPEQIGLEGFHSARRGQYRVIYRVHDQEVVVEVVKISHRSDSYS
jgi:mRNA-degrading endonuclease RelE of RelBE toxin-antitoxin system